MTTEPHESELETTIRTTPKFDPDLAPTHPINIAAANAHGVRYDLRSRVYRDTDGCMIYDSYGQPL